MSHFDQHREFYDKPIRLTPEQIANPQKVIDDFCDDYNLHEIRDTLAKLVECGMTNDIFFTPKDRKDLLFFMEQLEVLIDAIYAKSPGFSEASIINSL